MIPKKYIVSVGAGWQQEQTIKDLKFNGYNVIAIDGNVNAPGFEFSDIYKVLDIKKSKEIIEFLKNYNLSCSIAPNNDIGQTTSLLINKTFNLPGLTRDHLKNSINKSFWRSNLKSTNIKQPFHFEFSDLEEFKMKYFSNESKLDKIVIKPNDGSGSRGVFFIDKSTPLSNIEREVKCSLNISASNLCICEEFISGQEFSVEVFSSRIGTHKILLLSRRHMALRSSALAIEEITCKNDFKLRLQNLVNNILNPIHFEKGITHLEIIENNGILVPIDIAFRGGGYWVAEALLKRRIIENINVLLVKSLLKEDSEINFSDVNKGVLVYPREGFNSKKIRNLIKGNLKKINHICFDRFNKKSDDTDSSRYGIELWEKNI